MALRGTYENDIISEHLLQKYGNESLILPSAPDAHASIRMVIAKIAAVGVIPAMYQLLSNQNPKNDKKKAAKLWKSLVETNRLMCSVDITGPFFLGNQLTLADTSLVPFLDRFSAILPYYRGFNFLPPKKDVAKLRYLLSTSRERKAFRATSQPAEFYIAAYRAYAGERGRSTLSERKKLNNLSYLSKI